MDKIDSTVDNLGTTVTPSPLDVPYGVVIITYILGLIARVSACVMRRMAPCFVAHRSLEATVRPNVNRHKDVTVVLHVKPSGNQWYFTITASNNRVLASSERYWNKADAVHAAHLIVNEASGAQVIVSQ